MKVRPEASLSSAPLLILFCIIFCREPHKEPKKVKPKMKNIQKTKMLQKWDARVHLTRDLKHLNQRALSDYVVEMA